MTSEMPSFSMEFAYLLLAVFAVLLLLIFFIRQSPASISGPAPTLTPVEMTFRSILEKAVGERHKVYCKVLINELIDPSQATSPGQVRRALRAVNGRRLDYVVCDRTSGAIICLVELDDHRYESSKDYRRDLELEGFCYQVGLPILRVPVQKGYNLTELIERFENTIASMQQAAISDTLTLPDARKTAYQPSPGI